MVSEQVHGERGCIKSYRTTAPLITYRHPRTVALPDLDQALG